MSSLMDENAEIKTIASRVDRLQRCHAIKNYKRYAGISKHYERYLARKLFSFANIKKYSRIRKKTCEE